MCLPFFYSNYFYNMHMTILNELLFYYYSITPWFDNHGIKITLLLLSLFLFLWFIFDFDISNSCFFIKFVDIYIIMWYPFNFIDIQLTTFWFNICLSCLLRDCKLQNHQIFRLIHGSLVNHWCSLMVYVVNKVLVVFVMMVTIYIQCHISN